MKASVVLGGLLATGAFAAGGAQLEPRQNYCNAAKVTAATTKLNQSFTNSKQFCTFFLKVTASVSPVKGAAYADVTKACTCILKKAGKVVPKKTGPTIASANAQCDQSKVAQIKKAFKAPKPVCNFVKSISAGPKNGTPVPGLPRAQVLQGCQCILSPAATTAPATSDAPTTSKPATSAGPTTSPGSSAPPTTSPAVTSSAGTTAPVDNPSSMSGPTTSSPGAVTTSPSTSPPTTTPATTATTVNTCLAPSTVTAYQSPAASQAPYKQIYSGSGATERTDNPSNNKAGYTVQSYAFDPSVTCAADAIQACAQSALNSNSGRPYYSVDVHFDKTQNAFVCVQYPGQGSTAADWTVQDANVGEAYGYEFTGQDTTAASSSSTSSSDSGSSSTDSGSQ